MLKWLRTKRIPLDAKTCSIAAWGGQLEEVVARWNEGTCYDAAMGGQLEVLKWARENGCPWDERTTRPRREEVTWRW